MKQRPSSSSADRRCDERSWLERLYRTWHHRRFVSPDPLQLLYRYEDVRDREVVGLIASSLAYGNVKAMLVAIERVLEPLGDAPAARLVERDGAALRRRYRDFRYRFTSAQQLAGLLEAISVVLLEHGSLEACLRSHWRRSDETLLPGLTGFVEELCEASPCSLAHLLPTPAAGSACKRLALYLRWMVRRDVVDPGGWQGFPRRQLIVPLDTHVYQTARVRGWTRRQSADLRTALEITGLLRAVRPRDPLRYDFALTRPGIRRNESWVSGCGGSVRGAAL